MPTSPLPWLPLPSELKRESKQKQEQRPNQRTWSDTLDCKHVGPKHLAFVNQASEAQEKYPPF